MSSNTSTATDAGQLRPVACLRCRQRRSYCSKEKPSCQRCRDGGFDCVYEGARKILVNEAYLRELEKKAKALDKTDKEHVQEKSIQNPVSTTAEEDSGDFEYAEPLLESFTQLNFTKTSTSFQGPASSDMFLHSVSKVTGVDNTEASTINPNTFLEPGILPSKRVIFNPAIQLPPLHIARRFFSAQYSFIGPIFAFTESRDEFEQSLMRSYDGLPDPADQEACLTYAKTLMVMAFGQMYSVNQWVDARGPPGFVYFVEALGILPDTHEEGSLLCVETLALVGYFLQNMNCRDAAFQFVGRALRMAISLGLHQEVQENSHNKLDETVRERRRRVWWSIYSLDRILSVKSGNPITIQDDDIGVQLPSRFPSEPEYCPAVVLRQYTKLSKILGEIHNKIYRKTSRVKSGEALMASVQKIILALSDWDRELPDGLRFDPSRLSVGRESVSTLAHYYQCINMTVRPLVFHIVQKRLALIRSTQSLAAKEADWKTGLSQATVKVIEMCIGAAHDSISIMSIASQKDLVATYGYMDGEHIFSATIVLVMVCAAFPTHSANLSAMHTGLNLLKGMAERGNSHTGARFELLSRLLAAVTIPESRLGTSNERIITPSVSSATEPKPLFDNSSQITSQFMSTPTGLAFPNAGSAIATNAAPEFPAIDIQGLAEPFYDENASSITDFVLWEEGFAYPTMDLDLDLAQQQPQLDLHPRE